MDAYDLTEILKTLWQQNVEKSSGVINKEKGKIGVVVHTDEGFRNVVNARWDPQLKKIVLILDTE